MKSDIASARLRQLRDALLTGLVERDLPVRLALIATLAGEHLLMVGPPGTAKSLIARRLHLAFSESSYFERLLTRFTVPEELFGPLSIKGLEEDRYERLTEKYLPTASIAFLDEIFKANSAILNSLLTLLNEREFDNGARRDKTPLIAVIGASNELPESEELDALFDRFLLRVHVGSVSKDGFSSLISLRGHTAPDVPESLKLTSADLAAIQAEADKVNVPEDVVALLGALRDWCAVESIPVSDRRWRKIVKLLQVSALTNERTTVSIWDCWLLQHCLWSKAEDREKIYEWYASRVGATKAMDTNRLTRIAAVWEGKLKADQNSRSQMRDEHGNPVFQDISGSPTTEPRGPGQARRANEALFLAPLECVGQNHRYRVKDRTNNGQGFTVAELDAMYIGEHQRTEFRHWAKRDAYLADRNNWHTEDAELPPMMEPTRHKNSHITECLREIDEAKAKVVRYGAQLDHHLDVMATEINTHLWVSADFSAPAAKNLTQTQQDVQSLLARLNKTREGFEMLPREVDFIELVEDEADDEISVQ